MKMDATTDVAVNHMVLAKNAPANHPVFLQIHSPSADNDKSHWTPVEK
jgi:hypothetical protein